MRGGACSPFWWYCWYPCPPPPRPPPSYGAVPVAKVTLVGRWRRGRRLVRGWLMLAVLVGMVAGGAARAYGHGGLLLLLLGAGLSPPGVAPCWGCCGRGPCIGQRGGGWASMAGWLGGWMVGVERGEGQATRGGRAALMARGAAGVVG